MNTLRSELTKLERSFNVLESFLGIHDPDILARQTVAIAAENERVVTFLRGIGLVAGLDANNNLRPMAVISKIVHLDVNVDLSRTLVDGSHVSYIIEVHIKHLRADKGINDYSDAGNVGIYEIGLGSTDKYHMNEYIPYIREVQKICRDWETVGIAGPFGSQSPVVSRGRGGETEQMLSDVCTRNNWILSKKHTNRRGVFEAYIFPLGNDDNSIHATVAPEWTNHSQLDLRLFEKQQVPERGISFKEGEIHKISENHRGEIERIITAKLEEYGRSNPKKRRKTDPAVPDRFWGWPTP